MHVYGMYVSVHVKGAEARGVSWRDGLTDAARARLRAWRSSCATSAKISSTGSSVTVSDDIETEADSLPPPVPTPAPSPEGPDASGTSPTPSART